MADQGADANLISARMMEDIQQKIFDVEIAALNPARVYMGVTGAPCFTCTRKCF